MSAPDAKRPQESNLEASHRPSQKAFRNAVLGDLNARFAPVSGFMFVEVDLVSCHSAVRLNGLKHCIGTTKLKTIFQGACGKRE